MTDPLPSSFRSELELRELAGKNNIEIAPEGLYSLEELMNINLDRYVRYRRFAAVAALRGESVDLAHLIHLATGCELAIANVERDRCFDL
jgi:hypothetical protein